MPKVIFTSDELDNYFKDRKEARHTFYDRTVDIAKAMKVHADGEFPEKLIKERRPNEPQEVMDYREKIWTPKTKPLFSKVYSELQKIRRSSEWNIRYKLGEFTKISVEENLEAYCEKNFPYFTSLTNWTFSLLLRKYLIDPNAIIAVLLPAEEVAENEYVKPRPYVFDSCDVLDYAPNDYVVLNNQEGSTYYVRGKSYNGKSFYIITTERVIRYDQTDGRGNFRIAYDRPHLLDVLPVISMRGVLIDQSGNNFLYESRIAGILPELDEAVREYSDLQAARVLHIYPERWEFTQNECTTCKGTGKRINPSWHEGCGADVPYQINCDNKNCYNGYVAAGPYSKIMVRPTASMEQGSLPSPPAGYVEKDVEIVRLQDESVRQHMYDALSSINFEFLAEAPLNQSGIAKEVDRDPLNNTVHPIAEDIVSIMDGVYKLVAYYRYKDLYSFEQIDEMLPKIPVPEKFDILGASKTMEEMTAAKNNKSNPVILSALEVEYASQRFNNDPQVRDAVSLILKLDPLPNITEDDKMSRLSNKGITLESYIISSNIQEFIREAMEKDVKFITLTIEKQRAVLEKMAKEVMNSNSPVDLGDATMNGLIGEGGGNTLKSSVGGLTGN